MIHREFNNLAEANFGGSKPLNVSCLNYKNKGKWYLFPNKLPAFKDLNTDVKQKLIELRLLKFDEKFFKGEIESIFDIVINFLIFNQSILENYKNNIRELTKIKDWILQSIIKRNKNLSLKQIKKIKRLLALERKEAHKFLRDYFKGN